jgi:hypothetical protein
LAEAELKGNPVFEGHARAQHPDLLEERLARTSKGSRAAREHRADRLPAAVPCA